MRADHDLIITDHDLERLLPILDQNDSPAADALDTELRRAVIVPHSEVPPDVVTMNRDVVYVDSDTNVRRTVRIVYPHQADAAHGWISVLAPIGSALLGHSVGQETEWQLPTGRRRIRVVEVPDQPDRHD